MPPQYWLDGSPEGSSTESKERMPRMDAERMSTLADLIAHGRMRQTVRGHRHSNMCLRTEAEIRAEADKLLSSGLRETLESYGKVHIVGSYRMRLMAWRDLDVHLVRETIDKTAFFTLGGRVASLLSPQRMHFRDETVAATPGLPSGLYWGVYLGDERKGAWKIDIWATGPAGLGRVRSYCDAIARRLSSSSRETILQIKSECWQHPEYRRAFSSADIYTAVLEHGIEDVDEFWTFLERQGRVTCV